MKQKNVNTGDRFPTRISLILYFLKGSRAYFMMAVACSMLVSLFDMINPKIIQYTVDSIIGEAPSHPDGIGARLVKAAGGADYLQAHLWLVGCVVIAVALCGAMFRYNAQILNAKGAETLVQRMRNRLFEHIMHLPFTWHSENHTGDIIQRCTSDVETIKRFLSEQLVSLFRIVILISLGIAFMWGILPRLTLASLAFLPVIVLYSLLFHSRIGDAFEKADTQEGRLSAIAQENLTGVRVVRAFGREVYERERFEKQNTIYTVMWVRLMQLLSRFWATSDLISGLQIMVVTVLGAAFCVRGWMTAGEYIAFVSYNAMLTWPVRMLGRVISELSKAGISIDRIRYIMNSKVEQDRPGAVEPRLDVPGALDIAFEHVTFSYEKGGPKILDDVSFRIEQGTTVGILGGTGSGKSTLLYLLDRLYDLPEDCGRITIGGIDIRDIKASWLRENIGMVLQEPFLFSRSLAENIKIARPAADLKQIRAAAKTASLDDTIEGFTEGYETFVGERGVTLSGGQKQRTAIAQMLIRKSPVMVFDDSLSAVDAETDARIRHGLQESTASSTVILIAHRITTLMQADNIIVLDHGHIAEQGSHQELMETGGIYRRIFDLQAAAE